MAKPPHHTAIGFQRLHVYCNQTNFSTTRKGVLHQWAIGGRWPLENLSGNEWYW